EFGPSRLTTLTLRRRSCRAAELVPCSLGRTCGRPSGVTKSDLAAARTVDACWRLDLAHVEPESIPGGPSVNEQFHQLTARLSALAALSCFLAQLPTAPLLPWSVPQTANVRVTHATA